MKLTVSKRQRDTHLKKITNTKRFVYLSLLVTYVASFFMMFASSSAVFAVPVFDMPFTCGESWYANRYAGHTNNAIDWFHEFPNNGGGEAVLASAGGTATAKYDAGGYGNYVDIVHGGSGYTTRYAHLKNTGVSGEVGRGDKIGIVGSTGLSTSAHLHFEILHNGAAVADSEYELSGVVIVPSNFDLANSNSPQYESKNGCSTSSSTDNAKAALLAKGSRWITVGGDGGSRVLERNDNSSLTYTRVNPDDSITYPQVTFDSSNGWAQSATTTATDGSVWVVGVKQNGYAYTFKSLSGGGWPTPSSYIQIGNSAGWSTITLPSITPRDDGQVSITVLKADGRLYYTRSQGSGDSRSLTTLVKLGNTDDWVQSAVAQATNDNMWVAGVKDDGRVYLIQAMPSTGWEDPSQYDQVGQTAWSTTTAPDLTARGDDQVSISLLKPDGRLFTGYTTSSGYVSLTELGNSGGWAQSSISTATNGTLWVLGVKQDGRAFLIRRDDGQTWAEPNDDGFFEVGTIGGWSTTEAPSLTSRLDNQVAFSIKKADGHYFTNHTVASIGYGTFVEIL